MYTSHPSFIHLPNNFQGVGPESHFTAVISNCITISVTLLVIKSRGNFLVLLEAF